MTRLLIHVEGLAEEVFVNEVLRRHLVPLGYHSVSARLMGNTRLRKNRGGIRSWLAVKKDLVNHLRQDSGCVATIMADFYALPQYGEGAWPGRAEATALASNAKGQYVEAALLRDVSEEMGGDFEANRFVPFVLMHEFEALLFSDCAAFSEAIGRPDLRESFEAVRSEFSTPEDINDSPVTAPSKRIEKLVPGYEKPLLGSLAILEMGLTKIRSECPRFANWLTRLEALI
jgi:hypothetical protein